MNLSRNAFLAVCALASLAVPALAGVVVNQPANNSDVSSPFKLSATSSVCSGASVSAMGYSFDSSSDTTVIQGQSIDQDISSSSGTHTLHVKSWGSGTACVEDVQITVQSGSSTGGGSGSTVPSYAKAVSHIQALGGWQAQHDSGGSGSSSGSTATVSSPSLYGSTRRYETSFSNSGDERYSVSFADDTNSENFFYDTWVYLDGSGSEVGNLEFDVNQVMSDGKTVLVGVQCDGYTGHWAYTVNTGSASSVRPRWYSKTSTSCNPRNWARYKWHHVQFNFSRNSSGYIDYKNIWLDGQEFSINATAFGAADLGWGPVINTQFQIDGYGSGTVKVYLDNLTISRW